MHVVRAVFQSEVVRPFSDAEFGFDIMETDDGPFGFVEGRTRIHKTSKTAEKKAVYLPFVAQIDGAGDRAWALAWKEVLEEVASQRDP